MQQVKIEAYDLCRSPFFRMGRAKDLCAILSLSSQKLTRLLVQRGVLYYFEDIEINKKLRSLAVPVGPMRILHERIKDLLCRIRLGDYLYSPRRGRSAYANAVSHIDSDRIFKLDIRQFYPSTTSEHVFQFFLYRMRMAPDIAGRLTKLCTINGIVPFGSPLSPILCALVHDDVFSSAAGICDLRDTEMTLWVDDMSISGKNVSRRSIQMIRSRIASKRLRTHKAEELTTRIGTVITGVYIDKFGAAPANKSHVKIREKFSQLKIATTNADKISLILSLIGMHNYQKTVSSGDLRDRIIGRLQFLHRELNRLQSESIVGSDYLRKIF